MDKAHNRSARIAGLPGGLRYGFREGMLIVALALLAAPLLSAAVQTPTPFSVLIDMEARHSPERSEAEKADYPIWLESVEHPSSGQPESVTRLRLRKLPGLSDRLLLRLFFFDRPDEADAPVVVGWSETGEQRYHSGPLGLGLGLDASESLTFSGEEVDYLEITIPNDPKGTILRQILLASLKSSEEWVALDTPELAGSVDPFHAYSDTHSEPQSEVLNGLEPLPAPEADTFLFGRTRAILHSGAVRLSPEEESSATAHFSFTLGEAPLLGMATFYLYHADPTAPLQVWVNHEPAGSVAMQLPDLSDPGYLAASRHAGPTRFRYTGWVRAQVAFPGRLLRPGQNTLSLQLPKEAAPVVLHRLELQLKSHWQKLNYTIETP